MAYVFDLITVCHPQVYRLSCSNLRWVGRISFWKICGARSVPLLRSETGSSSTPRRTSRWLSVEASEIVEHFQWLTEEESKKLPPEKLAEVREEIGDVMIYLTELADKLGIDPVEAARAKVVINGQKYPADLVKGKASKYTEYR